MILFVFILQVKICPSWGKQGKRKRRKKKKEEEKKKKKISWVVGHLLLALCGVLGECEAYCKNKIILYDDNNNEMFYTFLCLPYDIK